MTDETTPVDAPEVDDTDLLDESLFEEETLDDFDDEDEEDAE